MSALERLRADVLDAFGTVLARAGTDLAETRRRMLTESQAHLAASRYFVVVCGEFRRGKSSLLNALVERPSLFPVDVAVTTSAITTLQWGADERALVYFVDDPAKPPGAGGTGGPSGSPAPGGSGGPQAPRDAAAPLEIPLADAVAYVTEQGNPENVKNVSRIEMTAPIPQLKSGMVLVDTPGVGSVNAAHTAATRAFLPSADAILFVAMATDPLGTVELEFLSQALEHCPVVVTAITMIDRVVDATPAVHEARKRIGEVSGTDPDELVVVGVSSQRKRKALRLGDQEQLAASGFPELERELWEGLAVTCGKVRIDGALDALEAAVADAAAPVANEMAALQNDSTLQKVEQELHEAQRKSNDLRARGSRWRRDLQDALEVGVRPARDRMRRDFDEVEAAFQRGLETERAYSDPSSLVREVSEGLVDAVTRANKGLAEVAEEVAARFSKETETAITAASVSSGFVPEVRDVKIAASGGKQSGWSQFRSIWGGGMAGGGLGATVGGVVGLVIPVVGPLLGIAVGGLIGQIAGWFGGRKEVKRVQEERARREHIANLRGQVRSMIESGRRGAERDFADQVRDCVRAMTKVLEDRLDAAAESQQESVQRLAALRRRTAEERGRRVKQLEERTARYTELRGLLGDLRRRASDLGRHRD
jgi:hypothetical protein